MAKQSSTLFLEQWLRNSVNNNSSKQTTDSPSAQMIIQSWTNLRDCLQKNTFDDHHLQSLKTLVNSQSSLYVAEPQAKLLISILSSNKMSLPHDSYPMILRLLYVWVRKSAKPSLAQIDLVVEVVIRLFNDPSNANNVCLFVGGVLLAGAFCFVPFVGGNTRNVCLKFVCRMLEEQYKLIGSVGELVPDVLAGIGYALSSSDDNHFVRVLDFLLGNWVSIEAPHDVSHGLLMLHLVEWVVFRLISSNGLEKIRIFSSTAIENPKPNYGAFAALMATAGVLRACNRLVKQGERVNVVSKLKNLAEARIEVIASNLMSNIGDTSKIIVEDAETRFLLHCLSLAASRSGGLSSTTGPLLLSLALVLLIEVFPLRRFYNEILESPTGDFRGVDHLGAKKHQDSIYFKEAGAAASVFCNLYASANEKVKCSVEDQVWTFCHDIYLGHRSVALLLQGRSDQLLNDLDKIAESAFLMIVVFALAVTKHRLTSKFSREVQMNCSVKILVSFSCMEYFRRIRLTEYMEAIRSAATSVQDNEFACVSFVESLPSYADLANPQGHYHPKIGNYAWSKDEVQNARILFYLRVIPTCVSHLPSDVFRKVVAATMFLYMGHPNSKIARASHLVFSSFVTSEKESSQDERTSLKEQLVFYYMKRSLEAYPGITPFDGLASGVSALVRHLPAGSPSIHYCIHSLVEKANGLCREVMALNDSQCWKDWQGDSEPCKKIIELLMQLISLVDIQVLPELMKLLAKLIIELPQEGRSMVLNELYALVAESDDVIRKPTLVSWLQSLSYLCSQPTAVNKAFTEVPRSANSLSLQNVTARL